MLIKRVVIQGFKTFAKRTEFVFDPGVTAIVGPNGSGKSNIVDAIRWCLGEQSFSLLRSKKTSDVIFSGSDQKARLGMAQVSISLDNSLGELPVDFAEIEVTRRAYRDGDNEYLLNGQRVRLQDITDLLAQTGLGRRTYALIGQGLIDKVLSLAPEELRGLFEEAAGITGYQHKRATTIRRLDATQQNLTRVHDILSELSPRLGYLRKQAERAKERAQLANDLRDMLRDWYGYHWHTTLAELTRSHATADQLKQKVEADHKTLTQHSQRIEQMRAQQGHLRGQVGELHHSSSSLHRDAEQNSRELAVGQERLRQLHARQEEARRELAPLRLQSETIAARIDDLTREVTEAESSFHTQEAIVQGLQEQVNQRQQERRQVQGAVTTARQEVERLQQLQTEATSRLAQIEERHHALTTEQNTVTSAGSQATGETEKWQSELQQRQETLHALDAEAAAAQQEAEQAIAQREATREQLSTVLQARQDAERIMDRLQTRHDMLARLQQEGAGYASGVRTVLQAARPSSKQPTPQLSGILGTIAALVQVPANLDKAIETALGGAFQNVVTQRWADTQAAIDLLKRTGNGRATFLPLDRLSVLPAIPAPSMAGVLGNAAQLIQYDPQVEDAVQQLLNRVWVVDTLETARRALDNLRGQGRPTVVTLDGDIVRPGGAVTGGSDQSRRDESILARERELRELPAQIRQANTQLSAQQQQVEALSSSDETLARQIATAQERHAAITRRERELRTQTEEVRRQLDRAQQSARWHQDRHAQIEKELGLLAEQRTELESQRQSVADTQGVALSQLRASESALEEAGSDDLLRQLGDQRAIAAQAQAAWQNRRALLEAQQRSLQTTIEQISAKEQSITQLIHEEKTLATRLRELTQREDELNRAIAEHQAKLNPSEQKLAQLEKEQAALESQERQAQEQLRNNESAWNAAQLHHQRTDDQLRQLQHDIEQDLGLVLLDMGDDLAYQPPLPWAAVVEQLQPRAELPDGLEAEVRDLRARLNRVSNVNPDAPREYAEAAGRHEYLITQSADLEAAISDLRKIVRELDEVMETELSRTFAAVSEQFVHYFQQLFNGGAAKLVLADPEDITNSGIEIIARPPGKRPQNLALLSGGERTLAALALIFAILRVSPTPFCVLDEVDAALDEANVDRFRMTVEELSHDTQFIIITHNRRTLEGTNAIYGITMASDGASRVISLQLQGEKIVRQDDPSSDTPPNGPDPDVAAIEELVQL
ncbi:MAG: chromosome segregation protein SMC [Caldilineaceae bacterium]|nr:chromosome segregation protein SMC [Caldilineaceae bacterium]